MSELDISAFLHGKIKKKSYRKQLEGLLQNAIDAGDLQSATLIKQKLDAHIAKGKQDCKNAYKRRIKGEKND